MRLGPPMSSMEPRAGGGARSYAQQMAAAAQRTTTTSGGPAAGRVVGSVETRELRGGDAGGGANGANGGMGGPMVAVNVGELSSRTDIL